MHPIRVAVQLHPQQGACGQLRAAAVTADEMGYDIAYTWDHFCPLYGNRDGEHFECWTLLAAWAEATSRIELGPLVACIGYRNPHLLADIARTVDHVSGGRVILGLGAGWQRRDYDAYGYQFGTMGQRIDSARPCDPGDPGAPARPQPATRPTDADSSIAGTGERKTLRLVAQYADGWHAAFPERPEGSSRRSRRCGAGAPRSVATRTTSSGASASSPKTSTGSCARTPSATSSLGFTQFTLGFNGPVGPSIARRTGWPGGTAKPVRFWRFGRVGSRHERAPPAGPAASLHPRRVPPWRARRAGGGREGTPRADEQPRLERRPPRLAGAALLPDSRTGDHALPGDPGAVRVRRSGHDAGVSPRRSRPGGRSPRRRIRGSTP